MYPDWPLSSADLVPLPRCDGPKLKPFNFQGAQEIDFLEYLGEGSHSHVFKFRFCWDDDWLNPEMNAGPDDRATMSAFYEYAEPFSCECRAFGRLQESGHEELAINCFGYILLDEDHERKLHSGFNDIHFIGNMESVCPEDDTGEDNMRLRFLGRDGRPPPIRGIVKEFAPPPDESTLQRADMKKILGDVKRLQQLGILRIDVAARQYVAGRLCDFSTAITVPHFLTTPELNKNLTSAAKAALERETFILSLDDYLAFDEMIESWNFDHAANKRTIVMSAFPVGHRSSLLHSRLRSRAARRLIYTHVDPRLYDWKKQKSKGLKKYRLRANPPGWFYDCGELVSLAKYLAGPQVSTPNLKWDFRDGMIFPRGYP